MRIELLLSPGCGNAESTRTLVEDKLRWLAPGAPLESVRIEDELQAQRAGFLGSPSVRIDGHDLEGRSGAASPGT